MPTLLMFLLWLSSVVHVSLFDARNFLAGKFQTFSRVAAWR
jgi:hypothetical protein